MARTTWLGLGAVILAGALGNILTVGTALWCLLAVGLAATGTQILGIGA